MLMPQRRITKSYFNFAHKQYEPLIRLLACQIGVDTHQKEELQVLGIEELLRCLICYKNIGSFMTFFYGRLKNVFRHERDALNKVRQILSVDQNTIATKGDYGVDLNGIVREYLDYLNEEEHMVITNFYLDGRTVEEIRSNCLISSSTIYRIKTRALNRMREKSRI